MKLHIYSDGVTESIDPAGNEWCEEGLLGAMQHRRKGAEAIVEDVFKSLRTFANGTPQPDDITLLVFEAKARGSQSGEETRLSELLPMEVLGQPALSLD